MKDVGIFLTVIGAFVLLLVMFAYLGATYGAMVAWMVLAGALTGIGIVLMIASKNED